MSLELFGPQRIIAWHEREQCGVEGLVPMLRSLVFLIVFYLNTAAFLVLGRDRCGRVA
jgi:hypothetical protein